MQTTTARIGVVEDDPGVSRLLALLLRERGHEVATYPCAEDALPVFLEAPPELVIVDRGLPGLDGLSLVQALRERYASTEMSIVLLSGLAGDEEVSEAIQAGADDCLSKPFQQSLLHARIDQLLARLREMA